MEVMAQRTLRTCARVIVARRLDLTVEGAGHLTPAGPVVVASHHCHHLYDGCALLAAGPRPLHLLVALDCACAKTQYRERIAWARASSMYGTPSAMPSRCSTTGASWPSFPRRIPPSISAPRRERARTRSCLSGAGSPDWWSVRRAAITPLSRSFPPPMFLDAYDDRWSLMRAVEERVRLL